MLNFRPIVCFASVGWFVLLAGCESPPASPAAPVDRIEVTPATDTLLVGDTVQFTAVLYDASGTVVRGREVEWSVVESSGRSVDYATIDSSGRFTVLRVLFGTTPTVQVRATSESASGEAAVTLYSRPARLDVYGTTRMLPGRDAQLHLEALDDLGYRRAAPAPTWTSSDTSVVSVSATGRMSARRVGRAAVTAHLGGATARLDVRVVAKGYLLTHLGGLGGDSTRATAINDRGQVVGWSQTSSDVPHAFLWEGGVMKDLGTGGVHSTANAINDAGQVAGSAGCADGPECPAIWENGKLAHHLPVSGSAMAINDRGVAIVRWPRGAFLWQNGDTTSLRSDRAFFELRGIDSEGTVVGSALQPSQTSQAVVVRNGTATQIAHGGAGSVARAINDAGVVVGDEAHGGRPNACASNRSCGFRWAAGQSQYLGSLGPWRVRANALNERGQVVGNDDGRAFLWEDGSMAELSSLLRDPAWELIDASGINEAGQIGGQARNLETRRIGAVVLTPEP